MDEIANIFLGILIAIIIAVTGGFLLRIVYTQIIDPAFFRFNRKKPKIRPTQGNSQNTFLIFTILGQCLLIAVMALESIETLSNLDFSLPMAVFILILIVYVNEIGNTNAIIKRNIEYKNRSKTIVFSLIILFIDWAIIIMQFNHISGETVDFSIQSIVEIQQASIIRILGYEFPAIYLIINPFIYLSQFFAIASIITSENEKQQNIVYNSRILNFLNQILINGRFFIYVGLMILLIGNGLFFSRTPIFAFLVQFGLFITSMILIGLYHRYEYRFATLSKKTEFRVTLMTVLTILGVFMALIQINTNFISITAI